LKLGYFVPVVYTSLDADKSFTVTEIHGDVAFVEMTVLHSLDVNNASFSIVYKTQTSDRLVTLSDYDLGDFLVGRNFKALSKFSSISILGRTCSIIHFKGQGFEVFVQVIVYLGYAQSNQFCSCHLRDLLVSRELCKNLFYSIISDSKLDRELHRV